MSLGSEEGRNRMTQIMRYIMEFGCPICKELTVDDSNSLLWIDRVYSDSGARGTKARDDERG